MKEYWYPLLIVAKLAEASEDPDLVSLSIPRNLKKSFWRTAFYSWRWLDLQSKYLDRVLTVLLTVINLVFLTKFPLRLIRSGPGYFSSLVDSLYSSLLHFSPCAISCMFQRHVLTARSSLLTVLSIWDDLTPVDTCWHLLSRSCMFQGIINALPVSLGEFSWWLYVVCSDIGWMRKGGRVIWQRQNWNKGSLGGSQVSHKKCSHSTQHPGCGSHPSFNLRALSQWAFPDYPI